MTETLDCEAARAVFNDLMDRDDSGSHIDPLADLIHESTGYVSARMRAQHPESDDVVDHARGERVSRFLEALHGSLGGDLRERVGRYLNADPVTVSRCVTLAAYERSRTK